jgi:DNA/RNA-binding domain of Phe-tRNA-synthetase-like protein
MVEITETDRWRAAFPGGSVGVLILGNVTNPSGHDGLNERKAALEQELRDRYGGMTRPELRELPVLRAYADYYRRFDKTYHVQLQLESVVLKGKPIPSVAALVEAMFMAELKNQLLTAGHDLAAVVPPVTIDVATEPTMYTLANGKPGELKVGDMVMRDAEGVICSVIYGQDQRTRLTPATGDAMFVVYAPAGIDLDAVRAHMDDITDYVRLFAPSAAVHRRDVYEGARLG